MNIRIILVFSIIAVVVFGGAIFWIAMNNQDYSVVGVWDVGSGYEWYFDEYGKMGTVDYMIVGSVVGHFAEYDGVLTIYGTMDVYGNIEFDREYKMVFTNWGDTLVLENMDSHIVETWTRC